MGYKYSGFDVSQDLQEFAVTYVYNNTDGDCENGMCEPDWDVMIISGIDEDEVKVLAECPYRKIWYQS